MLNFNGLTYDSVINLCIEKGWFNAIIPSDQDKLRELINCNFYKRDIAKFIFIHSSGNVYQQEIERAIYKVARDNIRKEQEENEKL